MHSRLRHTGALEPLTQLTSVASWGMAKKDSCSMAPEAWGRADESHVSRQDEEVGAVSTSGTTAASQTSSVSSNGDTRFGFTGQAVVAARKTIETLLTAGRTILVANGACLAARSILNGVETLHHKADDVGAGWGPHHLRGRDFEVARRKPRACSILTRTSARLPNVAHTNSKTFSRPL